MYYYVPPYRDDDGKTRITFWVLLFEKNMNKENKSILTKNIINDLFKKSDFVQGYVLYGEQYCTCAYSQFEQSSTKIKK